MSSVLHLRVETKSREQRSALTPDVVVDLINHGYTVNVERSRDRIYEDEAFAEAGAALVPTGSWVDAPTDHIIIGLKELPEEDYIDPLKHTHVQFAHCFKGQDGWQKVLSRYSRGGGTLLDLEFLEKDGRRVAAFGYWAGFAGAALALKNWALKQSGRGNLSTVKPCANRNELVEDVKAHLSESHKKVQHFPRVIVIGALGRCGQGAVHMCLQAGIPEENILKWDMAETAPGGPFKEIIQSDIFINCIYLTGRIPPFVTLESMNADTERKLSVICDVSADSTNPLSPVPVYTKTTTFDDPIIEVEGLTSKPAVSVISIDHLPSLLPNESSDTFSRDLLPYLRTLMNWPEDLVWAGAAKLYRERCAMLPQDMQ